MPTEHLEPVVIGDGDYKIDTHVASPIAFQINNRSIKLDMRCTYWSACETGTNASVE